MQQQRRRKVDPKSTRADAVPARGSINVVLPAIHPPLWTPPPVFTNPHAPVPMKMAAPEPRKTGPPAPERAPYVHSYSSERPVRGIRTLLTEEVASICPFTESPAIERDSKPAENLKTTKLIVPVTLPDDDSPTTFTYESPVPDVPAPQAETLNAPFSEMPICTEPSAPSAAPDAKESVSVDKVSKINDVVGIVPSMATTTSEMLPHEPATARTDAPILFPTITPTARQTEAVVPSELMASIIEAQVPDIKTDGQSVWPELSISDINTTFNVVGGFKSGIRLKIVNDRYLAEDGSYLSSVYRYAGGQSREKNLSFVGHLFNETKRHTVELLAEIRRGIDVDTKISELDTMIGKMMVFIHNFDMIREPYQADTGTYAKFGVILDSFSTFRRSFFRDMVLTK